MIFPIINDGQRLGKLNPPNKKVRIVLDTDTFNEIDDQFAIVYALKSSEKIQVEAIYAAPFWNKRSSGPADGMEKSYEEIIRLLSLLNISSDGFVYKGSEGFLQSLERPYKSEAALDLVNRALKTSETDPLYVVSIGAITNVASAILIESEIIKKIVIVWLGGHPFYWQDTKEFNLQQDILSSRLILDCGVPLVRIPCLGVASHLLTTVPELEVYLKGNGKIADYLFQIFYDYSSDHFAWAKEIWDISTIAWIVNPEWVPSVIIHSPVLTDNLTWSIDNSRHFIRDATFIYRNPIFKDLFNKLSV